jgi:hypothetical protein
MEFKSERENRLYGKEGEKNDEKYMQIIGIIGIWLERNCW